MQQLRKLPALALAAIVALSAAARADSFSINEPIASQREVTVFLVDPTTGNGVSGLSVGGGLVLKIAKSGANWTTPGATIAEVTGGPAGSYRLSFTTGDVDTAGDLLYSITDAGVIRPFVDRFRVELRRGALDYNLAQGGASGSITLASASSSTDNYYAGAGKGCVVMVVSGPGAGQARLGTGYTGSTRQLAVTPNWVTNPTGASVYEVLPYTGLLDASEVTAIQSGLATDAHVLAIPTTPELAGDTRLNHLDADISSRASSAAVAAIPTNPLLANDAHVAHLDADISSRASAASVAAIPTNPLITTDARLNDLDATISSRSTQTSVNAIPTGTLLSSDVRLNHLDADISTRATSAQGATIITDVLAIPTNPLLTSDVRLNDLDATISSRATAASVAAIPTTPLLTSDVRLNDLDAAISTRATDAHVLSIPTNPLLTSDVRLNDLDATISSRATDAHVLAIPTNPELSSDARLGHLDADISTRATDAHVLSIPTNPVLASDARIAHLDADVSTRLAPSVAGRTLAVLAGGQTGIDWGNIANPTAIQNLSATIIQGGGGGGGGGGSDPTAVAAAVWAYVPDANAPLKSKSFQEQWNVLFSIDAGNADGLDGTVGSTKSLDTTKHRSEFTIQAGKRTFTARDGD